MDGRTIHRHIIQLFSAVQMPQIRQRRGSAHEKGRSRAWDHTGDPSMESPGLQESVYCSYQQETLSYLQSEKRKGK